MCLSCHLLVGGINEGTSEHFVLRVDLVERGKMGICGF